MNLNIDNCPWEQDCVTASGAHKQSNSYISAMSSLRLMLAIALLLLCAACTNEHPAVETSLYFGLSRPGGGVVPDSSWLRFEQEEVIRVFPKGFTVIPANGVWRGSQGLMSENTRIVVSLNTMEESLSKQIDSLRERYKTAFGQESVMRVDKDVERWDF